MQTVAHLRWLFQQGLRGPFLIVAPLAVTPHWAREFDAWVPEMHVVSYAGRQDARDIAREYEIGWKAALDDLATQQQTDALKAMSARGHKNVTVMRANVIIVSSDTLRSDLDWLATIKWQALVVDEAHQVRNAQSKLCQAIDRLDAPHKVGARTGSTGTRVTPAELAALGLLTSVVAALLACCGAGVSDRHSHSKQPRRAVHAAAPAGPASVLVAR